MSPSFLLLAFAVVLCGVDAASLQRYRRQDLPEDDANYLTGLYNRFRNDRNLNFEGWSQFAIMVVNRPDNLVPCPLDINVMNAHAGANYVAYTPMKGNVGTVHAETMALGTLAYYVDHNNPTRIYLFTYLSPCEDCTNELIWRIRILESHSTSATYKNSAIELLFTRYKISVDFKMYITAILLPHILPATINFGENDRILAQWFLAELVMVVVAGTFRPRQ